MMLFLRDTLTELGIEYYPPTQRIEIVSSNFEKILSAAQHVVAEM